MMGRSVDPRKWAVPLVMIVPSKNGDKITEQSTPIGLRSSSENPSRSDMRKGKGCHAKEPRINRPSSSYYCRYRACRVGAVSAWGVVGLDWRRAAGNGVDWLVSGVPATRSPQLSNEIKCLKADA